MFWLITCVLGACGGAIAELVPFWEDVSAWQRRRATTRRRRRALVRDVDLVGHASVLVVRMVLGAVAASVLQTQVTGAVAAIAVGASAPLLLAQLGRGRTLSFGAKPPNDDETPRGDAG